MVRASTGRPWKHTSVAEMHSAAAEQLLEGLPHRLMLGLREPAASGWGSPELLPAGALFAVDPERLLGIERETPMALDGGMRKQASAARCRRWPNPSDETNLVRPWRQPAREPDDHSPGLKELLNNFLGADPCRASHTVAVLQ
jgi:hypothetical protein